MGVRSALRSLFGNATEEERSENPYSWNQFLADYNSSFIYNGLRYGTMVGTTESIDDSFEGIVNGAVKSNGVVFGCLLARQMVFSDVRFVFRELRNGTPGDFIGNPDGRNPASAGLKLLQNPWEGATTGDLLTRMIADADIAGNAFIARRNNYLVRLRPDWVTIVAQTPEGATLWHPDAEVLGYLYKPGGYATDDPPIKFLREEVAHFAPVPDPQQRFRGMSWIEPVLTEIMSDKGMTQHKQAFFDNGATVNMVLKYDPDMSRELFKFAKDAFDEQHGGAGNAYKTLHLLGAEPVPVGSTMEQMDFKTVQGHGETRIAVAAGVPPIIVGLSEGLESATYSNYGQARRAFADRTIRPLWRNACASLAQIITAPPNTELWYDDTDVAFIREDQKDAADIRQVDGQTIKLLVDAGYKPETVIDAVSSGDWKRLQHTGLFSVQLQPPQPKTPQQPKQLPDPNQPALPMDMPQQQKSGKVIDLEARRMELAATIELARAMRQDASQEIHIHNQQPEVRIEPTTVEVGSPDVHVEPHFELSQPDITVNTPDVNVDVTTPDVKVDVQTPEVRVESPIEVNVDVPDVTVEAPVTVQPAEVRVETPPVEVNVETPVNVELPEQPAPEVHIEIPKTRKRVIRDDDGKVSGMEEEPIIEEET